MVKKLEAVRTESGRTLTARDQSHEQIWDIKGSVAERLANVSADPTPSQEIWRSKNAIARANEVDETWDYRKTK